MGSIEDRLISREQAQQIQQKFAESLHKRINQPVVFHVYGMGGVGKTTLLQVLNQQNASKAHFVGVSFDLSLGIETPLKLMFKLYEELEKVSRPDFWHQEILPPPDPFLSMYKAYEQTLQSLETQPVEPKGEVTIEQVNLVKQLAKFGFSTVGQIMPGANVTVPVLEKFAEVAVDGATLLLTEKDRLQKLLKNHQATRRKKALQDLMLEPLLKLTQAFAKGIIRKSKKHPVVIVLDTYEKAPSDINTWLWQYLLANTDLRHYRVRLVVAGRYNISKNEGWQRIQQNWNLIYERRLDRFNEQQTQTYLTQINIKQDNQVQAAYRTTKGLPYYLNWLREQKDQGIEVDFSQGHYETTKVLLQGLNSNQKRVVQLAACCRWFNKVLLQYLVKHKGENLDFQDAVDEKLDCFDWLIQRDFVKVIQFRYYLDDVARELFRISLWQEDQDLFHEINTLLSEYFERKATQTVSLDSSMRDQMGNSDWRNYKSEALYHQFFSQSNGQNKFLFNLVNSNPLKQSEVVKTAFTAINAESEIIEHPLLPHAAKEVLTQIRNTTVITRLAQ